MRARACGRGRAGAGVRVCVCACVRARALPVAPALAVENDSHSRVPVQDPSGSKGFAPVQPAVWTELLRLVEHVLIGVPSAHGWPSVCLLAGCPFTASHHHHHRTQCNSSNTDSIKTQKSMSGAMPAPIGQCAL